MQIPDIKYPITQATIRETIDSNEKQIDYLREKGDEEKAAEFEKINESYHNILTVPSLTQFLKTVEKERHSGTKAATEISQKDFVSKIELERIKNQRGYKEDSTVVTDKMRFLYRKLILQPRARKALRGYGKTTTVLRYATAGLDWAFNATMEVGDILGRIPGAVKGKNGMGAIFSGAKIPEFKNPNPEKELEENLKTLLYKDEKERIDDSNLDLIIETMSENKSIREQVVADKPSTVQTMFSKALTRKLSISSPSKRKKVYSKVLRNLNKSGVTMDADQKTKIGFLELQVLSNDKGFKKTIKENKDLFSNNVLTKDIFAGSMLKRTVPAEISKDNSYYMDNQLKSLMNEHLGEAARVDLGNGFVEDEMGAMLKKVYPGIDLPDNSPLFNKNATPVEKQRAFHNILSNLSNLFVVNESLKSMENAIDYHKQQISSGSEMVDLGFTPDYRVAEEFLRVLDAAGVKDANNEMRKRAKKVMKAGMESKKRDEAALRELEEMQKKKDEKQAKKELKKSSKTVKDEPKKDSSKETSEVPEGPSEDVERTPEEKRESPKKEDKAVSSSQDSSPMTTLTTGFSIEAAKEYPRDQGSRMTGVYKLNQAGAPEVVLGKEKNTGRLNKMSS